jgi:hypothetical protein
MAEFYRSQPDLTPERIQFCREWIARRRAELDQKKKQFEDEYPLTTPQFNKAKLDLLEAKEFWIDLHEWELDKMIEALGDEE